MRPTTTNVEAARRAAELVALALRRARPTDKSDYRELLDQYGTDLGFRDIVDAVAEGLGLRILAATRAGLVLAPGPDSVFAARLVDLRAGMDGDDKLVAGLALVGIAAYAYPKDVDLDDPDTRTVDIPTVDEFIRAAATAVEKTSSDEMATARSAAEVYLDWPSYLATPQGRYKRGCTYRALEEVLGWLVEHGMARPQPALGTTAHQLTDRFRVLVGDEASNAAYIALRELRAAAAAASTAGDGVPVCSDNLNPAVDA